MKFLAVSATLAAAIASANAQVNSIPSQTLNSFQAGALATLSAAQAAINSMNSQHVADNKASQDAALLSQSMANHDGATAGLDHGSMNSEHENSELGSLDVDEASVSSSASSVAGSMLAIAFMAGAAMF
ncbi:hypothetical protein IW140_001724 [Coemansia sp. RSA 1813]|nr:hypothetical protein EV178_001520 [Coemansia sp. RSA 1646]KAJ1772500.1 hypothetical protein LPJ74_001400 [Coemansia sp. RSA 1843]KAJ2090902.1 hypothetical protein IW138_002305 [Coemansia sp. RSA 986]KAJ2214028.1 hypothetical protein EV179_003384 [Coemansia sp. RSA 487]KAJ2571269.1 hypothetical protein IW140_001724 [Coemansia sp. RSA 1813]